jgi:hypothetical protein
MPQARWPKHAAELSLHGHIVSLALWCSRAVARAFSTLHEDSMSRHSRSLFFTSSLCLLSACAEPAAGGHAASQTVEAPLVAARSELSPVADYAESLLQQTLMSKARLTWVIVLDGMRPDLFNAEDTPNLFSLRQQGVTFANGHFVFPTVTRVNSPSIATGMYPQHAGVIGNSIYVPQVDPSAQVNTGDWRVLTQIDTVSEGKLLFVQSLAERLHAAGKTLAAVSSGSSGSAYLLNHRAAQGVGALVNGYLEDSDGRVAPTSS